MESTSRPEPLAPATAPAATPLGELHRALLAAEPAAFLVEPRVLRRVVRQDRGVGLLTWHGTHRRSYAISAERALRSLSPDELGLGPDEPLPPTLFLLARPDPDEFEAHGLDALKLAYWRLLFHARVHAEVDAQVARGRLRPAELRERIDRIGQAEFDEIRGVLRYDHDLHDIDDAIAVYVEFAAVYLELRHFAAALLPDTFPSLRDPARVDALLASEVDAPAILDATRLDGLPGRPPQPPEEADDEPNPDDDAEDAGGGEGPLSLGLIDLGGPRSRSRRLLRRADGDGARGNHVRAAISRQRAAGLVPAEAAAPAQLEAQRELERLAARLAPPLGLDAGEVATWSRALHALLPRATIGRWSPAARLLYDLQKIAVEHGREVYAVDLVAWVRSLGRVPIKRPLPNHRAVQVLRHLRSARRRLRFIRLEDADRERLRRLLDGAVARAEADVRERFRPRVAESLLANDVRPRNLPERVAFGKLTEELLDRVVTNGFVSFGDLRDAVSRSDLKLPDIAQLGEFFGGDRLLRADRTFASALDGVYRRAEVYLRLLQRLCSLGFGTGLGRAITLYLALPFGAAFVLLEGVDHLLNPLLHALGRHEVHLLTTASLLGTGLFLAGMINVPTLRREVLRAARQVLRGARRLVWDAPRWVLNRPFLRRILDSRAFAVVSRWALKPLPFGLATYWLLPRFGVDRRDASVLGVVALTTAALLLNSRPGRDVEEILADYAVRGWNRFRRDLIPGLYRLIVEVFHRLLEGVERLLYALDELIRFRSGEGRVKLAVKAVLGLVVFLVAYVVRIYVVLLIEPQVNPIKHFPVVTVSHKIMLPFLPRLVREFRDPLEPLLGRALADTLAGATIFLLPGVFGFLVWELKENWKLYEANRPRRLRPLVIGHHGETMARLLRPGFHSGTIPKLFARLRRAHRKPVVAGRRPPTRKFREGLDRVRHEVEHFVDRELIDLLAQSRDFGAAHLEVAEVRLGTNRVEVHLASGATPGAPLVVRFEEQSGWLVAGIAQAGWLEALDYPAREAFGDALAGLYKRAGVDLVREQLAATLGGLPYDIADRGLLVWPEADYRLEVCYPLRPHRTLRAQGDGDPTGAAPRALAPESVLFSHHDLTWDGWVEVWRRDQRGEGHQPAALPGVILPPRPRFPAPAPRTGLVG
jgi:hypothetical protein